MDRQSEQLASLESMIRESPREKWSTAAWYTVRVLLFMAFILLRIMDAVESESE